MKFSIRHADKIVGLFVILALAILIFVVFMLGRNQRWFAQDYHYKTYFNSATGISPNMAILYKGFTIGHVKRIDLTDDDLVEIYFTIFEEYALRVTEGSLVEVSSSPIPGLGGGFNFYPGRGTEQIPDGGVIPEINSIEARQLRIRGLTEIPSASDSIGNIINQVNALLETINIALSGSREADNQPLGQILSSLARTAGNIDILTGALPGQINDLVGSLPDQLFDVIDVLVKQINLILGDINLITKQISSVADQVANPSGTVMSLLDGEGPVYEGLASSITSISGVIDSLDKTAEYIPAQMPQITVIINELNSTLRSVQDVLTAVANNPLLRGGIPERVETGPGGASPRNLGF